MKRKAIYLISFLALALMASGCDLQQKPVVTTEKAIIDAEPSAKKEDVLEKTKKEVVGEMSREKPDINTIRSYYYHLSMGELEEAYEMYQDKNVSFEKYKDWYKDVTLAHPYEFKEQGENRYQFFVDLYERHKEADKYRVVMEVNDGKVQTLFSELLFEDGATFGNMKVYTKQRFEKNSIILSEGDQETVIEEAPSDSLKDMSALRFIDPWFSDSGKYLVYRAFGWEWGVGRVYDIENKEIKLKLTSMSGDQSKFTPGERYFYSCSQNEMAGDFYGRIYSAPDFKLIYDVMKGDDTWYYNILCEYRPDEDVLRITLSEWDKSTNKEKKKIIDFHFDTRQAKIIK